MGEHLHRRHHDQGLCGEPCTYQQITIRISAIDAPEKAQDFGNVSRQHLAALCFQQAAKITPKGTDRYKRTIADVECQDKDVGQEQVRAGLAWYYVKYGRCYEHLAKVEQQARDTGRGVWSMQAVSPWEWRKRRIELASPLDQKI